MPLDVRISDFRAQHVRVLANRAPSAMVRRCHRMRLAVLLAGGVALGGCAGFSPDGGFGPVEQTAKERLGKDLRWARNEAVSERSGPRRSDARLLRPGRASVGASRSAAGRRATR